MSVFGEDEEEILGEPSFEVILRDGEPVVAGSYFILPPLRLASATYDPDKAGRILVTATDGTVWYADDVPSQGDITVKLQPLSA
jgi:hypothetical protein